MPLKINGATSGYVQLSAPDVAGSTDLTLPSGTGTLLTAEGGKVLQIVRASTATTTSTTSTSYTDVTNMSVTITPTSATSTILIIGTTNLYNVASSGTVQYGVLQLTDSSNTVLSGAKGMAIGLYNITRTGAGSTVYDPVTLIGYAAPATTSAVTYKMRIRSAVSTNTAKAENSVTDGQMYAIEVSA